MLSAARRAQARSLVLDDIIAREGRDYVNHPADKGGPTRYGVTLGTYRSYMDKPDADEEDIRHLDEALARRILQEDYLEGHGFEKIEDDLAYGILLDCSVLHGPRNAKILLQRAVNTRPDGHLGPITAGKANALRRKDLVVALLRERARWFVDICERDETQLVFLEGWMMNRVFAFLPY